MARGVAAHVIVYFAAVVDDPDLGAILAQVEGALAVWVMSLPGCQWLIGCHCTSRPAWTFAQDAMQALADAVTVREMLRDVELELEW